MAISYSPRGENTEIQEASTNSGSYYDAKATYWANGMPHALTGTNGYAATYNLDGEGRVNGVLDGSNNPFVSSVTYQTTQPSGALTGVTFGSGDFDTYSYDSQTGRMTGYQSNVGTSGQAVVGALTWNQNGTLQKLLVLGRTVEVDSGTTYKEIAYAATGAKAAIMNGQSIVTWWAFMIRVDGIWRMFFEVMNWKTGKGEIGLAESPDGYSWTYREIVLAEPFHLSYPYVFEWHGGYYMVPESYQAKSIRLYRAEAFPTQWSFIATLKYGPYHVDPSIFRHADKWWLFAETNPDVKHDCLRLYYADELAGPWIEHPKSPIIKNNPKIARPAGRVLNRGNRMIRFAQDCSSSYGSEVRAFAVTELTTESYVEELVCSWPILAGSGSGWNAEGMHHIDVHAIREDQWIACVDGRRKPCFETGKSCQ